MNPETYFTGKPNRLRPVAAAKYLGVSIRTLEVWRAKGIGPPFVKIVGKILYELADLDAFLDKGKYVPRKVAIVDLPKIAPATELL